MIKFSEEDFKDYQNHYDVLSKKTYDAKGHVPPTSGPLNLKYASFLCDETLTCSIKFYSIKNSENKIVALFHGLDTVDTKTGKRGFGLKFSPSFFLEDHEAIALMSCNNYNQTVKEIFKIYD